jgi:hypothetical protein
LDWLLRRYILGEESLGPLGVVTDHVLPPASPPPDWHRPTFESLADDADKAAYGLLCSEELTSVERGLQHFRNPDRASIARAMARDTVFDDAEAQLQAGPDLEGLPLEPYVTLALATLAEPERCASRPGLRVECLDTLHELPRELGAWVGLERLTLINFIGRTLPDAVLRLTSLRELVLGAYELVTLPDDISRLTELRSLDLAGTAVSYDALLDAAPSLRKLAKLADVRVGWQVSPAQRAVLESARGLPQGCRLVARGDR